MSAAATRLRSGTHAATPTQSATRSWRHSSRARTGAGAMSTKPTSDPGGQPPGLAMPPAGPLAETPDLQGAYPRLSGPQIAALEALGQRRTVAPAEMLFAEGDRNCDFYVVLAGHVAGVEGHGQSEGR